MENTTTDTQAVADQIYNYAASLLVKGYNFYEVKTALMDRGLDEDTAATVVENAEEQIARAKRKRAGRDMLFGALWCVGGIVATAASVGYIFWGAIVFGGYQLIRGAIAMSN